jgi:hypothetical protein
VLLALAFFVACGPSGENNRDGATGQVSSDAVVAEDEAEPAQAEEENPEAQAARQVSYRADVLPIFEAKCVSCHHRNNAVKVILTDIFDPELGMINRPNTWTNSEKKILVVPGDPDASALVLKVEATELEFKVDGDLMPWNIPLVTEAQLRSLGAWIDAGAADDGTFRTAIRPIFGDGVSLGSRGGKCAYCHHSFEGAYQPDLVDAFNPQTGAVDVASYYGGLRIAPGNASESVVYLRSSPTEIPPRLEPLMPKHYERLTPREIEIVREWIALGARND